MPALNSPRTRKKPTPVETATSPSAVPRKTRKVAATTADSAAAAPRKRTKVVVPAQPLLDAVPTPTPAKPRTRKAAKKVDPTIDVIVRDAVVARLDAMKANDLKVIDVRGKTSVTDCLVIASGTSTRHVKSMGDEVVVTAKKHGMAPIGIEGEKDAEWILVDLGDTVVHVMLPKTREFYGLERLWSLAEESRSAAAKA